MPATVSFNADHVNWFDLKQPYKNLIRVKHHSDHGKELKVTSPFFEEAKKAGHITNVYAREHGTTIYSFRGATTDIKRVH